MGLFLLFAISCEIEDNNIVPVLSTMEVTEITSTTATSGGEITDDGGAEISKRGVVWGTEEDPTLESNDGFTEDGHGIGEFVSELTDLTPNTTYYVRAYATNPAGTQYGQQKSFTTLEDDNGGSTVTDVDGNTYNTVIIGTQEWMVENLRTTKYADGTAIPTSFTNTEWGNAKDGAYSIYPHSEIDGLNSEVKVVEAYGKLYNWYAVDDARGLCPTGWRVPTEVDWNFLIIYVWDHRGYPNEWNNPNGAGNALKSCRQVNNPVGGHCDTSEHPRWNAHNTHIGIDDVGFSGLPGGARWYNGNFSHAGIGGHWWSSTEITTLEARSYRLLFDQGSLDGVSAFDKSTGAAIRCVRDID